MLWINQTALSLSNYPHYFYSFIVDKARNFIDLSPMFDIPPLYYPNNSTIEPRCFIGLKYILTGGSTSPVTTTEAYVTTLYRTTTNPFSHFHFRTPLMNSVLQPFR